MPLLYDSAPGFDQPIAVLMHCHSRIHKQLATLNKLPAHLEKNGANIEAQQAVTSVIRYFTQGAPHHHHDEEDNLFPLLRTMAQGEDAELLQKLLPVLLQEHHDMDQLWQQLLPQLNQIQQGHAVLLNDALLKKWSALYIEHIKKEENTITPMALRILTNDQLLRLGTAMQARRHLKTC